VRSRSPPLSHKSRQGFDCHCYSDGHVTNHAKETTTGNSFTWTPRGLSTGVYRIDLLNNKSRKYGYGPSFKFLGPDSTWTTTRSTPSATSSPTPSSTSTQSPNTSGSQKSGHGLGAIVGVAVGSVVGIAILVAAVTVSLRYRRMVKVLRRDSCTQAWPTARNGSSDPVMRHSSFNKVELDASQTTLASPTPVELDSKEFMGHRRNERPPSTYEMDAQPMSRRPQDDRTDSRAVAQGGPKRERQSW
jgi:hypothetical protein